MKSLNSFTCRSEESTGIPTRTDPSTEFLTELGVCFMFTDPGRSACHFLKWFRQYPFLSV